MSAGKGIIGFFTELEQNRGDIVASRTDAQLRIFSKQLDERMERLAQEIRETNRPVADSDEVQRSIALIGRQMGERLETLSSDTTGRLDEVSERITKKLNEVSESERKEGISEEQMALIDEKIKEIRQELLSIKEDLGDKTHKESVSAYRNIKSDIEELKKYIADSTDEKLLKKAAGFAEKAFVLGIINLIAILAIVSYQTGFFGLLL